MNNSSNANFQYPVITASQAEIPQSILSSSAPGLIESKVNLRTVQNQYGTCGPSQNMNFVIPTGPGSGFLKSGSMYLYATLTATTENATPRCGFNHSLSADALINRVMLYYSSTIADVCLNYNRNIKMIDANASNATHNINDMAVLSFKNQTTVAVDGSFTIRFCIPIKLSALIAQQDLPLFLTSQCNLEVATDTITSSFLCSAGVISNYTMSNIRLVYETFNPSQEYENSLRSVLAQGKMFSIPLNSWYNSFVPNAGTLKTIPVNYRCNSLLGVFHYSEINVGATPHLMSGDVPANPGLRVMIDGQLMTPFAISDTPVIFAESRRAFGVLGDSERSASYVTEFNGAGAVATTSALTQETFLTKQFTGGLSLIRSSESGLAQVGTPVNSQLQIEVTNAGTAGTLYYFLAYQQIMAISADGSIQMIKY